MSKSGGSGYDSCLSLFAESPMKSGIVAPLVLILLGAFFLANNLGWTDLSLGRMIATWWPAILIVVGVVMLFDRSRRSR